MSPELAARVAAARRVFGLDPVIAADRKESA